MKAAKKMQAHHEIALRQLLENTGRGYSRLQSMEDHLSSPWKFRKTTVSQTLLMSFIPWSANMDTKLRLKTTRR
jgi:hypothetical protein